MLESNPILLRKIVKNNENLQNNANIWNFEIRPVILIFFRKNVFDSYERARQVGQNNRSLRSQKLTLDF